MDVADHRQFKLRISEIYVQPHVAADRGTAKGVIASRELLDFFRKSLTVHTACALLGFSMLLYLPTGYVPMDRDVRVWVVQVSP
jgi:hypothetical protein